MSLPPLAMSESKTNMMRRLGLSGSQGEQVYKLLLEEASRGRDRLSNDFGNLTKYSKDQRPSVQPPYKWDELQETKRHHEVLRIVHNAGPHTKYYYALGRYIKGQEEENWVAQWFLWHCFRYRDNRPRTNAVQSRAGDPKAQFFDPVYDGYR